MIENDFNFNIARGGKVLNGLFSDGKLGSFISELIIEKKVFDLFINKNIFQVVDLQNKKLAIEFYYDQEQKTINYVIAGYLINYQFQYSGVLFLEEFKRVDILNLAKHIYTVEALYIKRKG